MTKKITIVFAVLFAAIFAFNVKTNEVNASETETTPAMLRTKTVGVLLFPGFEMLDAYGPMELWGNLRHAPAALWGGQEKKVEVTVVTIAAKKGEIASSQGPKTVAEYGFDDAPRIDILLVPGGMGVFPLLKDQVTIDWLRMQTRKAEQVMSVCNGASLLAATGILDGQTATTNKKYWEMITKPWPKVKWVKKARWVDNGAIVTSSGVSAGMDMSLAVIRRLYGKGLADWLEALAEYEPHRDPSWDPFAAKYGLE